MQLKVCGMKYAENIEAILGLKPDYMGFIFYPQSKRYVTEVQTDFINQLDFPNKTAVFINADLQEIITIAQKGNFKILQLHGDESPELCAKLKNEYGFTVIKAFGIGENFDFSVLEIYKPLVDYFLFDTKGKEYGGNGLSFDWNILKNYDQTIPFFLSGGIGLENMEELISFVTENKLNLQAIDVNSRFETEPGLKDRGRIEKLIKKLQDMLPMKQ